MQEFFPEHFGAAEWILYLDDPDAKPAMREHIAGCEACGSLFESVTAVSARLQQDGRSIRSASVPSAAEIDQMLDRCLGEIRMGPHPNWSPVEALLLLRVLLEPICGKGTAGATISLARLRSTGRVPGATGGALTPRNWSVFISNLSEAMGSICGAAAGQLVRRAGFSIALAER